MEKKQEQILLKTTSIIEIYDSNNRKIGSATCFFIKNENDDIFLVSNRHVLKPATSMKLCISHLDSCSNETHKKYIVQKTKDIFYSDDYDLGIMKFTEIYNQLQMKDSSLLVTCIPYAGIENDFAKYNRIEEVLTVGYPKTLINKSVNLPIVRNGITSSGLCDKLNNKEEFFINIPTVGGSSGSPVFHISDDKKVKLIGIVDSYHVEKVKIYQNRNRLYHKKCIDIINIPTGIGYVIKTTILLELLNQV